MALFRKAEVTSSYLKMGIMGFAGSGKTFTSTAISIGLTKLSGTGKPIFFLDTETGSDWIKPRVEAAGLELFTAKTRAFRDLLEAVPEAERNASLLLVDSLSHFWTELCDAYMRAKKRTRLQFEDWAFLKSEWRKFTDLFVNGAVHTIVCGRAGFEYDYSVDEDTGKKNLEKTGIKMKAEGEMGYEPSILLLMERRMDMETKVDHHYAKVIKDRSGLLDGKEFRNPTFENFLPHIKCLNLGGAHMGVDTTRTSVEMIPVEARDHRALQRSIVLDEIQSLLVLHFPSTGAEDKKRKLEMLRNHWRASWTEMEKVMPLEQLRAGFDSLHLELEGRASRYTHQAETELEKPEINDSLPDHSAPPMTESSSPTSAAAGPPTTTGESSSTAGHSAPSAPVDEAELLERYDMQLELASPNGTDALQVAVDRIPIEYQVKLGPRIIKKHGPAAVKADKALGKKPHKVKEAAPALAPPV